MKWLHVIIAHAYFIAVCAVALCWQTSIMLSLPINTWFLGFVFFATLVSYNAYWLLTQKIFGKTVAATEFIQREGYKIALLLVYCTGLVICFFYSPVPLLSILPAIVLNGLYVLPILPLRFFYFTRRLGFLKTSVLAFTWTYVTGFLPLEQSFGTLSCLEWSLLANRFLFMLLLCILFDIRDVSVDKMKGLQNIATNLSNATLQYLIIFFWTLLMGSIYAMWFFQLQHDLIIALLLSAFAMAYTYYLSTRHRSYLFYYFFVDGLMLFSAGATYIAGI